MFSPTQIDLASLQRCLDTGSDDPSAPPLTIDLEEETWCIQNSVDQRKEQSAAVLRRPNITVKNGTLHLAEGIQVIVESNSALFVSVNFVGRGRNPCDGVKVLSAAAAL